MYPERKNYHETVKLINDVANLTGLDEGVVRSVFRAIGLQLAHNIAEQRLIDDQAIKFEADLPFIGTLNIGYDEKRPSTKANSFEFFPTETFRENVFVACRDGKSAVEDAVIKKFVDTFIEKYQSVI